jgi:hypothetical protein
LVLPHGYKDVIRAFVQEQLSRGDDFDDVVYGKGEKPDAMKLNREAIMFTDIVRSWFHHVVSWRAWRWEDTYGRIW